MNLKEEKLSSTPIFSGVVFDVSLDSVKLPNGKEATRELITHNGGVAVVALTQDNKVLLVRQYRYGIGQETLELPAGKLEKGEDPKQCGMRELKEETGYTAENFEPLTQIFSTPAFCSEIIYLYKASSLTSGEQNLDPGEFLKIEEIPFSKAVEMCLNNTIKDAKTIIGILTYNNLSER